MGLSRPEDAALLLSPPPRIFTNFLPLLSAEVPEPCRMGWKEGAEVVEQMSRL